MIRDKYEDLEEIEDERKELGLLELWCDRAHNELRVIHDRKQSARHNLKATNQNLTVPRASAGGDIRVTSGQSRTSRKSSAPLSIKIPRQNSGSASKGASARSPTPIPFTSSKKRSRSSNGSTSATPRGSPASGQASPLQADGSVPDDHHSTLDYEDELFRSPSAASGGVTPSASENADSGRNKKKKGKAARKATGKRKLADVDGKDKEDNDDHSVVTVTDGEDDEKVLHDFPRFAKADKKKAGNAGKVAKKQKVDNGKGKEAPKATSKAKPENKATPSTASSASKSRKTSQQQSKSKLQPKTPPQHHPKAKTLPGPSKAKLNVKDQEEEKEEEQEEEETLAERALIYQFYDKLSDGSFRCHGCLKSYTPPGSNTNLHKHQYRCPNLQECIDKGMDGIIKKAKRVAAEKLKKNTDQATINPKTLSVRPGFSQKRMNAQLLLWVA